MQKKIAIIGAGMAGLTLAQRLHPHAAVVVFEKARGVGGRMATRHADPFAFDHGTQFFTARHHDFAAFLAPHISSGLVAEWKGKVITLDPLKKISDRLWFEPHYVACPGMASLCKKMAEGIQVQLNCEVAPLIQAGPGWSLVDNSGRGLGDFDLVVSTAPPVQTCRLFESYLPTAHRLYQVRMQACFAMMFGWQKKWEMPWMAARINNSALDWLAINSTKPGRNAAVTSIVVHSSNTWATAHVDDDLGEVERALRAELRSVLQEDFDAPDYFSLHRWRYALLDKAHDDNTVDLPFYEHHLKLASVGDWGSRSRIEDVWLEANFLADEILA